MHLPDNTQKLGKALSFSFSIEIQKAISHSFRFLCMPRKAQVSGPKFLHGDKEMQYFKTSEVYHYLIFQV